MRTPSLTLRLAALLGIAAAWATPANAEWQDVATVSSTLGNNAYRVCVGGGGSDLGCPVGAPLLDIPGNRLTVPGDLRVVGNLLVSGSQSFDGVTFANGGVSATGTISATSFSGNGSGITGIDFSANPVDRIISGTTSAIAHNNGAINFTTAGTERMNIGTSGNIGIGTSDPSASLHVTGNAIVNGLHLVRTSSAYSNPSIGINTSNRLFINGGSTGIYLATGGFTSGNVVMSVDTTNKVLIGGYGTGATTLDVSGSLKVGNGGEAVCNPTRAGAIKFLSGQFYVCRDGATWEILVAGASGSMDTDRITSGTTQVLTTNNASITLATAGLDRVIVGADGRVGIGTVTPSALLNVNGTAQFGRTNVMQSSDSNLAGLNVYNASGGSPGALWIDNANAFMLSRGNTQIALNGSSSGFISLRTTSGGAGIERMNIGTTSIATTLPMRVGALSSTPSTTLDVAGTIKIANSGEACDANRTGAIKYDSGQFQICRNGTSWETMVAGNSGTMDTDRITSGTQAGVIANDTGYISLTTGGVTGTAYFNPMGVLTNSGLNSTGGVSATTGYFDGNVLLKGTTSSDSRNITIRGGGSAYMSIYSYGNNNPSISAYRTSGTEAVPVTVTANNTLLALAAYGYNGSSYPNNAAIRMYAGENVNDGRIAFLTRSSGNTVARMQINPFGLVIIGSAVQSVEPSTSLQVQGSIRMAAETSTTLQTCDANRTGAIKYQSGQFQVCRNGTSWETLVAGSSGSVDTDRITSGTTAVVANATGSISLTTGSFNSYISSNGDLYAGRYFGTDTWLDNDGAVHWSNDVYITGNGINQTLSLGSAGSNAFTIVSSSHIGIGTDTPATRLDVAGTLKIASGAESCDASRTGAIKFQSNQFYVCQNGTTWEQMATTSSNTLVSINTGLSGSIVFRDEYGYLKARNSFNISSTTGSVGIGAGPLAALGNDALYVTGRGYFGNKASANNFSVTAQDTGYAWPNNTVSIIGNDAGTNNYISLRIAGQSAMYVASSTYVGLGTLTPSTKLEVSGTLKIASGAESCDASRTGAIKFESGNFLVCRNGTSWETLVAGSSGSVDTDRITSGTTSVVTNQNGYISLTTNGTTTGYLDTSGLLTVPGVSITTTHGVSSTRMYTGIINVGTTTQYQASSRLRVGGVNQVITEFQGNRGAGGLDSTNLYFYNAGSNIASINVRSGTTTNSGGLSFATGNAATATDRMTINQFGLVGINTTAPSTTLHTLGSLRIAAETSTTLQVCDANRTGAIKYESGDFFVCRNGTSWETLVAGASGTADTDRITSGTTAVVANTNGNTVSVTTGGTTTSYFHGTLGLVAPGVSATGTVSSADVNTGRVILRGVAGSAGVSLSNPGDNLGNHTATQNLDMSGFNIVNAGNISATGNVSANKFIGDGSLLTNISASNISGLTSDRITSGTTAVVANTNGNTVSITTGGTTTSYFHGTLGLVAPGVSTTGTVSGVQVFTPLLRLQSVSASAGVSLSNPGDNLGNHTATQNLDMATFNIVNAGNISATGNVSANKFIGDGSLLTNINASNISGLSTDRLISGTSNVIVNTNGAISFTTAGTERMNIAANGRVGIGTTAPQEALDVTGNIKASDGSNSYVRLKANGNVEARSVGSPMVWSITNLNSDSLFSLDRDESNGNHSYISIGQNGTSIGSSKFAPSTTLHVSGTLRIANGGESCDTDRTGAIRFTGGQFQVCRNGTSWETLVAGATGTADTDRITSGTTSVITYENTSATIATNGIERMIVGTDGNIGIAQQPVQDFALSISGTASVSGRLDVGSYYSGPKSATSFVGLYAGFANTGLNSVGYGAYAAANNSGNNINAFGLRAAMNNTGSKLTAIGGSAAIENTGSNVTAIGDSAASNNTASNITAVGENAAYGNTGSHLTAIGESAAWQNSGPQTTAIGVLAASFNKASFVTAIGESATPYNEASGTTAIGFSSMIYNNQGAANTAVGYQTLMNNETGSYNTALGYAAGQGVYSNSFSANTLLGAYTGIALTTGSSNTIVGANSGMTLTTGENNILLGTGLTTPAATTSNYLSIGNAIFGDISSGLGYANKIGINIAAPTTALEVSGTVSSTTAYTGILNLKPVTGSAGISMTFSGADNLGNHTATQDLDMAGHNILNAGNLSTDRIISGTTSVIASNNTSVTINTNGVERMVIGANGRIGIGTTAPAYRMDLRGNLGVGTDMSGTTSVVKTFTTSHSASNVDSSILFGMIDGATSGLRVNNTRDGSYNSQSLEFLTHHGSVSNGVRMTIDKEGFVGIGTQSPTTALEVSGTVSGTTLFTPLLTLQGVSSSAGISMTSSGADNLGNHTATQDLNMGSNNIVSANNIAATGSVQVGDADNTCSTLADYGKMRFNSTTKKMFMCRP